MQALVAGQIFAERKRDDREGILVVGADTDALGALVSQRPDIDIGVERIACASVRP